MPHGRKRTILVADDEALFTKSLAEGLERHNTSWRVLTACDGNAARELLDHETVDLLVTDLAMPGTSGFELLAHVALYFPGLPVIVITAHGNEKTTRRLRDLGLDGFLEKPLDFDALVTRISDILDPGASGFLRGISLPTFLQILELDRKTCRLRVVAGGRTGQLDIVEGDLYDAATGALSGEAAASEIVGWGEAHLEMTELASPPPRKIQTQVRELILETMRRQDERNAARRSKDARTAAARSKRASKTPPSARTIESVVEEADPPASGPSRGNNQLEERIMVSIEKLLGEFKGVKGYIASGVMDFAGEMLAFHSEDASVRLDAVGAVFNDIFRGAHEASRKIGLDACSNMVLMTPKGIVIMECSGADKTPHLHGIAVLQEGGNQALARMTLGKVLPQAVKELS